MKNALKIIIPAVLIIAAIAGGVAWNYAKSVSEVNSDDATGNTAGNLLNGGLFCEYNNKIYFANPYDHNYLYVMDSDCTNAKRLNMDSVASINVYGNYIYYVKNNFTQDKIGTIFRGQLFGVYKTDLEGKNSTSLYNHLSGTISLCGNYLYYQHYDDDTALTLRKVSIDGKEDTLISEYPYSPASINNGLIYFTNTDHKSVISTLNPKNDSITTYYDANSYMVIATDSYIYYIDVAKNYSLVRLNKSTKTVELLYSSNNGKIVNYNLYGNKIFFQLEGDSNPGLYRMNADGTQPEYIATGNLTNIHCTSQYTFFQYYENQGVLYRVPTSGAITFPEEITIQVQE
jgi:hypothetical protein